MTMTRKIRYNAPPLKSIFFFNIHRVLVFSPKFKVPTVPIEIRKKFSRENTFNEVKRGQFKIKIRKRAVLL